MIIDPDFLDHWKTRTLVVELDDEMAPLYLIRLWAHCQLRKTSRFDYLPPHAIKAICRYGGDANRLDNLLVTHGYTDRDGDALIVCGWAEANAYLVNAWENGSRGGRKKTSPKNSAKKPVGIPTGEPTGQAEEKRREEKRDVLLEKEPKGHKRFVKPTVAEVAAYCRERNNGIDARAFIDHYEANGWKRGKTPVKDWRACVRTWEANRDQRAGPRSKLTANMDQLHDFLARHGDESDGEQTHDCESGLGPVLFLEPPNGRGPD